MRQGRELAPSSQETRGQACGSGGVFFLGYQGADGCGFACAGHPNDQCVVFGQQHLLHGLFLRFVETCTHMHKMSPGILLLCVCVCVLPGTRELGNEPLRMLATVSLASLGRTEMRLEINSGGRRSTTSSLRRSLRRQTLPIEPDSGMKHFAVLLCLPALTVLHQSGEIIEVCAQTHHALVSVQSKQYTMELGEVSVKHLKKCELNSAAE